MSAVQEFIFRFKFFDRYYANVFISSNGVLYFDSFNAIFHQPPKPFPIYGLLCLCICILLLFLMKCCFVKRKIEINNSSILVQNGNG